MSKGLLTVLTVAEIVLLVAVLGTGLIIIAKQLRSIGSTLAEVTWGARAVERQLRALRSNVGQINWALEDAVVTLPSLVEKAERAAREGVR